MIKDSTDPGKGRYLQLRCKQGQDVTSQTAMICDQGFIVFHQKGKGCGNGVETNKLGLGGNHCIDLFDTGKLGGCLGQGLVWVINKGEVYVFAKF